MRVAICDTDANIMKLVEEFVINSLKSRNEEVFIEKYDSSLALSDDISDKAVFDVCFIHAEMKGLNGVETTREIKKYRPDCMVVIYATTENYSVAAWKVDAFFYLLMPATGKEIDAIIDKVESKLTLSDNKFIRVKMKDGWYHVPYRKILYIESEAHKANFVLTDKEILTVYGKLDSFEEALSEDSRFIRIHKSVLINGMYIKKFSSAEVVCMTGEIFRVSRNSAEVARDQYEKYISGINSVVIDE